MITLSMQSIDPHEWWSLGYFLDLFHIIVPLVILIVVSEVVLHNLERLVSWNDTH